MISAPPSSPDSVLSQSDAHGFCHHNAIPTVSVMIVAYNSAALISDCIAALRDAASDTTIEVLLVDNGDGTTEALVAESFPEVRIVPSRGNIGFAGGNNLLASQARGQYLLLLNPDMIALPGSIDALVAASERYPDAAAWGAVTVDEQGKPDTGNAIAMPSLAEFISVALGRSIIGHAPVAGLESDAAVEVLVGGFVLFARSVWHEAGGLDERYFLYCEEVDLFYRLQQKGYQAWRIPAARGAHKAAHGNTLSAMRLLYQSAGRMEFVRAHWPFPKRLAAGFLVWIAAVERVIAGKIFGHRRPHLSKLGAGYRLVALRPDYWFFGYHKKLGLMAKLARSPLKN